MTSRASLGEFQIMALAAVMRLGDDSYGVRIHQEIEARSGRAVSIGAVYTTLERLEAKGYLKTELGEPTAERGGRAKRYFRITAAGGEALRRSVEALGAMVRGLKLGAELL